MIFQLAQWLSKDLVQPGKNMREVCHDQYYEKKRAKNVCHQEDCLFFEMLLSNDLLGHKNMTLSFAQIFSKNLVDYYKLFPETCQAR